jgi:hypothetical protein
MLLVVAALALSAQRGSEHADPFGFVEPSIRVTAMRASAR